MFFVTVEYGCGESPLSFLTVENDFGESPWLVHAGRAVLHKYQKAR